MGKRKKEIEKARDEQIKSIKKSDFPEYEKAGLAAIDLAFSKIIKNN